MNASTGWGPDYNEVIYARHPALTITGSTHYYLCPDLLDHRRIGAADNLRGRVVRAFFFVMRVWPPRR